MNSEVSNPQKGKSLSRTLTDTVIGLSMAKKEILGFQREVAANPKRFIQSFSRNRGPQPKVLQTESAPVNDARKKTQDKILEKICLKIQEASDNTISQTEIQAAIEEKCITRTLSVLYAATYQWKDQEKKDKILQHAGETFSKDDGSEGTRAGGICHAFLRQNGLLKKITHDEMAKELKGAFEETFQKTRGMLAEDGFEVDESQLRKILACELFRRTGGRNPNPGKITSAKEAARAFCKRIEPDRTYFKALAQNAELLAATNDFVENQIPKPLRDHLLENPLKPVYERNPQGGVLLHPDSGKPMLNQELPEKWRKEEIPTAIESSYRKIEDPLKKEETGLLLDTLRIPRKLNIPLNSALEELLTRIPEIPEILQKAQEVEKGKMAYEIAKGAHSLAYRLGIATAAAGENLLSPEETQFLSEIQLRVNAFPENGGSKTELLEGLRTPGRSPEAALQEVETLWRKSTLALEKSLSKPDLAPGEPDSDRPKVHEPVFTPLH